MQVEMQKHPYASPQLIDHGDLKTLTQLAGSGAVDAIFGTDIDGDGDTDSVVGNGSGPLRPSQ